jgi:hypothetical protein
VAAAGDAQISADGAVGDRGCGMYYEEQWRDGWLWIRRSLEGPWVQASEAQMIARMRHALELVVEATDCPADRRNDPAWLRGALLASRAAALTALGR